MEKTNLRQSIVLQAMSGMKNQVKSDLNLANKVVINFSKFKKQTTTHSGFCVQQKENKLLLLKEYSDIRIMIQTQIPNSSTLFQLITRLPSMRVVFQLMPAQEKQLIFLDRHSNTEKDLSNMKKIKNSIKDGNGSNLEMDIFFKVS